MNCFLNSRVGRVEHIKHMQDRQDWSGFGQWHLLLDELCDRRGFIDNARLASQLCRRLGRNKLEDFNTAEKSVRNWRLGRHAPLRRNFVILSELLEVAAEPGLARQWNLLYASARGRDALVASPGETPAPCAGAASLLPARRGSRMLWTAGATALAALVAAGAGLVWHDPYGKLPIIGYDAQVRMVVGETRLIHGDRGDCDGHPPDWYYTSPRVPVSTLGTFSDGGLARKMSNFCNAVVPVRAVKFTATAPGTEELRLLDDFIKIVVTDRGNSRLE